MMLRFIFAQMGEDSLARLMSCCVTPRFDFCIFSSPLSTCFCFNSGGLSSTNRLYSIIFKDVFLGALSESIRSPVVEIAGASWWEMFGN